MSISTGVEPKPKRDAMVVWCHLEEGGKEGKEEDDDISTRGVTLA